MPPASAPQVLPINKIRVHIEDFGKLLAYLHETRFYPTRESEKSYRSVFANVFRAWDVADGDASTLFSSPWKVRSYLFHGSSKEEVSLRGLFVSSENLSFFDRFRPGHGFTEPLTVDRDWIADNPQLIHALLKLAVRDPKTPGVVNTFGNPMRFLKKNNKKDEYFVAEFTISLIPEGPGFPRECSMGLDLSVKIYKPVRDQKDIRGKGSYLVGDPSGDKCYLVSAAKARAMREKGYAVGRKLDGREKIVPWIAAKTLKDESVPESDRVLCLSSFARDVLERLREAGCDAEFLRLPFEEVKRPSLLHGVAKRAARKTLGLSALNAKNLLPFIPTLPGGCLPVHDRRTEKTQPFDVLLERLFPAPPSDGEKTQKYLSLIKDDDGHLHTSVRPIDFCEERHRVVLDIVHEPSFYEKRKLEDPYGTLATQDVIVQHITDTLIFPEKPKNPAEKLEKLLKQAMLVILQEIALKQMVAPDSDFAWRRFVQEPLWECLSGLHVCAPGRAGQGYTRWCVSFPEDDAPLQYGSDIGCWHEDFLDNKYLMPWEQGDEKKHYAFLRKGGVVVMIKVGGVECRILHEPSHLDLPHKERVDTLSSLVKGVRRSRSNGSTVYVCGGVDGFQNLSGQKRHMSAFYAWVLEGTEEDAWAMIEPLLYPGSGRLGGYPARPFALRLPRVLHSLFEGNREP